MKGYMFGLALLSLFLGLVTCAPEVTTPVGVLQGVDGNAPTSNKAFHVYYAIPYAAAPVGDLRFKPPQAFTSDDPSKVITSNTFGPACPQTQTFGNPMNEDCLFLNVYTPSTGGAAFDTNAKKKVLVFIHGGAFSTGDTSIYPTCRLATDNDLIVVTLQYRLGPLGFLSSGSDALPGNFGLRDQIFALQWVKDNIAKFGGDPDDVTLSGQSAGATSCSLISLSPMTKGLFTKVILMSGSALAPWAIDQTYRETFDKMAERSKCKPDPCTADCESKIVECLRKVDAMEMIGLIARDAKVSEEDILALDGYMSYAPVVDGEVLPRDPFDLMRDKDYLKDIGALDRKYIVGVDNNEAMVFVLMSMMSQTVEMNKMLNIDDPVALEIVKNNLRTVFPYPANKDTIDLVKKLYYNPRDKNGLSDLQSATDFMSDIDFVVPTINFVDFLMDACSSVDVYYYLFDVYPPMRDPNFLFRGSSHGGELPYVFDENGPIAGLTPYADVYADECKPVMDIFRGMLGNFANSGDPSLPGTIAWPKYDKSTKKYVAISPTPKVQTDLYQTRMSLWKVKLPKLLGLTTLVRGHGHAPIEDFEGAGVTSGP